MNALPVIDPQYTLAEQRTLIKSLLQNEVCNVTFTKVDGAVRTMPCTLQADLLPAMIVTEGKEFKEENLNVLSVWCMDAKAWRSFRVASVTAIDVIEYV